MLTMGAGVGNLSRGLGGLAQSALQGLGWRFKDLPEMEHQLGMLVGNFNEAGMSFAEQTALTGKGDQFESTQGKVLKGIRKSRRILDAQLGAKGNMNRTPLRGPTGIFKQFAATANWAVAVGQLRMVLKVSEQVEKYMDAHGEWDNPDFNPSDPKVLKRMLGSGYRLNKFFGKADTLSLLFDQIEQRFEMNFADFVRKQRDNKQQGKQPFNMYDLS